MRITFLANLKGASESSVGRVQSGWRFDEERPALLFQIYPTSTRSRQVGHVGEERLSFKSQRHMPVPRQVSDK